MSLEAAPRKPQARGATRCRRYARGWLALFALLAVCAGTWLRSRVALHDPAFAAGTARGLLRTDPALLYYVTERLASAEGLCPPDWRADPRIEYPDLYDIPAELTVGQEFVVAWLAKLCGKRLPLHVLCIYVASFLASLTAIAVIGLAFELTQSLWWTLFALVLYLSQPASYRTLGFVLVNEDLSLPLLITHLWLAARALRKRTRSAYLLAGLSAGAALATWHAAAFFLSLAAAVLLCVAWLGRNPAQSHSSSWAWAAACLCTLLVPALRTKAALFSLPLAAGFACLVSARWTARSGPLLRGLSLLGALALWLALGQVWLQLSGAQGADLAHVWEVLFAKLRHAGQYPEDPQALSFAARLLWQGPFEGLPIDQAYAQYGSGLVLALAGSAWLVLKLASAGLRRVSLEQGHSGLGPLRADLVPYLLGLTCVAFGASWLVARVSVFCAPLLALSGTACGVLLQQSLAHWRRAPAPVRDRSLRRLGARLAPFAVASLLLLQVLSWGRWLRELQQHGLAWYRPYARSTATAEALDAVEKFVPEGASVAADFMLSPAILAETGRAIVLQPKWEKQASRERVRLFWQAFYHGNPEELRQLLCERWQTHYLLLDHAMLKTLRASRRLAALKEAEDLPRGSAAAVLLSDPAESPAPAGYELLWQSNKGAALHFALWRVQ